VVIVGELGDGLNMRNRAAESVENLADVCAGLHRDDAKLILLVDPHKEGLVVVVENASSVGPVAVEVAGLEETVTLLEKEVVSNKLFAIRLLHAGKGVEFASEITLKGVKSLNNLVHDLISLLVGDTRAESEVSEVAADTNTGALDHLGLVLREGGSLEILGGHL
jgi:hypothetical protein